MFNLASQRNTPTTPQPLRLIDAALDSVGEGVLVLDDEGKISAFNRKFSEIWNLPSSETSNDKPPLLSALSKRADDPKAFLCLTDSEKQGVLESNDGSFMEWRSRPLKDGDHQIGQVLSFRDVSERKLTEERENALAAVTHDLKNMLSSLILAFTTLQRARSSDDADLASSNKVDRILATAWKMDTLLNSFLTCSKIRGSQLPIEKRSCDVLSVLANSIEIMEPIASKNEIRLIVDTPSRLPAIQGDPIRLLQAITNLLSNAMKYTPAGGAIRVTAAPHGDTLLFSLKDTGVGIPSDHLPHIFERFWQGRPNEGNGVGLGLSIVKGIIEAHGGRVWVESQAGKGSNFLFTLPLDKTVENLGSSL